MNIEKLQTDNTEVEILFTFLESQEPEMGLGAALFPAEPVSVVQVPHEQQRVEVVAEVEVAPLLPRSPLRVRRLHLCFV